MKARAILKVPKFRQQVPSGFCIYRDNPNNANFNRVNTPFAA